MNKPKDVDAASDQPIVLLPCPFCGEQPTTKSVLHGQYLDIECKNPECRFQPEIVDFLSPQATIDAWNQRYV